MDLPEPSVSQRASLVANALGSAMDAARRSPPFSPESAARRRRGELGLEGTIAYRRPRVRPSAMKQPTTAMASPAAVIDAPDRLASSAMSRRNAAAAATHATGANI